MKKRTAKKKAALKKAPKNSESRKKTPEFGADTKSAKEKKFAKETMEQKRLRSDEIVRLLRHYYPNASCALNFETPFQLLIATILSAQCTDERVNLVTAILFKKYPDAQLLAKASLDEIESIIRPTGFFKNKAKSLLRTSQKLVGQYAKAVPQVLEQLVELPGVGRKTANVVLGTAFGIPSGVVVDTHVNRLTHRLGLAVGQNPVVIEKEMMVLLKPSDWIDFSHLLIHHGRAICKARKPRCEVCFLIEVCPQKFA